MTSSPQRDSAESEFATTHWSIVITAGTGEASSAHRALAELCRAYWYPIYAFVRRRVGNVHDAQDGTQSFFSRLLEGDWLRRVDAERGRFRAFLLTACKRFLINEWRKQQSQKRGGGQLPASLDFDFGESRYSEIAAETLAPDRLYEQQWAITLLGHVLERLRSEAHARNKHEQFNQLKQFLSGADSTQDYATVAEGLKMSVGAVKVAVHRLRARYREFLRDEIAQTVDGLEAVDDEIRRLFAVLG